MVVHQEEAVVSAKRAIELYEEFHKFKPRQTGEFPASFEIPQHGFKVGTAKHVMYRSDKLHPLTHIDEGEIDYIHEHHAGVKVVRFDARARDGVAVKIPKWIWNTSALVKLGKCLGFQYKDAYGDEVDAEATEPLPSLYATPNGKALLVIQGRSKLIAVIYGGKLGVEPRGIVH
jgi:hypothetical protein